MPNVDAELLSRFGIDSESATKLGQQAEMAERVLGIHGVSAAARVSSAPARRQFRKIVEAVFRVHDTPSRRDLLHRTVELPKPVTEEIADEFNQLFR